MSDEQSKQTNTDENRLKSAAKTVGSVAGKIVSMVGGAPESDHEPVPEPGEEKTGKLKKKNHNRLPRKVKKAQQRAHGSAPAA